MPASLPAAANGGHVHAVARLAALNHDLNARDYLGRSPLHDAAMHGRVGALEELVRQGANLAEKGGWSRGALGWRGEGLGLNSLAGWLLVASSAEDHSPPLFGPQPMALRATSFPSPPFPSCRLARRVHPAALGG